MLLRRLIHDYILPVRIISEEPMVFPCGISRSGTTLLATVLDAHSKICLGYELLPPPLAGVETVLGKLRDGMTLAHNDFARAGSHLRKGGDKDIGQWLSRCHRAGTTAEDVEEVLKTLIGQGRTGLTTMEERLRLCTMVVQKPQKRNGSLLSGFKYSGHRFDDRIAAFPNASFIYILRDPRDIIVSMREREFDRTLSQICGDWNRHLHSFETFLARHPKQAAMIRYEDLVSQPIETIGNFFSVLPVNPEPAVYEFQNSTATVLNSRHPNTENLKKGFFTDSIGRWRTQLQAPDVAAIERECQRDMPRHGYDLSSTNHKPMTTAT
ncbi:MAG: sulfotransferase [Planctomycetota bacterium]|nr:sulfotransferase [Planctomycetota bacterium]MDA1088466.1 sulfotransferase [Verrucomicrobiota bacterium]